MATHVIPITRDGQKLYGPGHFSSPARVRFAGSRAVAHAIGGWDATGTGRRTFGADPVPGPHAYAFGLAAVIDNHGGSARESADASAAGLLFDVHPGDFLIIDGTRYTWTFAHGGRDLHNVNLIPIDGPS